MEEEVDPHLYVINREYNWFINGKGMFNPPYLFYSLALMYYPCILLGKRMMKNREPFVLRELLFVWNAFMSLMSFIGCSILFPYIYEQSLTQNLHTMMCAHDLFYTSRVAYVVAIFNATKCLEWGDTVFLILRKKRIVFLHGYHHLVTYLFCWHASLYSYKADATGVYFCAMNLAVHSVMYGYYALRTLGIRIKYRWMITLIQTMQMCIGIVLLMYTPFCRDSWRYNAVGNLFAIVMYTSYLYQFSRLFFRIFPLSCTPLR